MLRDIAHKLARKCGVDFHRVESLTTAAGRIVHFMNLKNVQLVLDVGANKGQFAAALFDKGYDGRIVSFEPLPDAYNQLTAAAQRRSGWIVAPRVALGAASSTVLLNVAGNSVSSSLLAVSDTHVSASPESHVIGRISVDVRQLDDMMQDLKLFEQLMFLKMDTQGTEYDILLGAHRTLEHVVGIQMELSLIELYESQALFDQVHAHIRRLGFELWDVVPGFREPRSGRLLQIDGVYFRQDVGRAAGVPRER